MKELEVVLKNIKNKTVPPVNFFHGPEAYFIDLAVDAFEEKFLSEDEKAFDQSILYGKDTSYPEIFSLARQYPMMAGKSLIIVKEAQDLELKEEDQKAFLAYLEQPTETTVLVFAHKYKKLDGKKQKLNAAVKEYLFFSDKIKDHQLPTFIANELKRLKIQSAPNISHLLAEYLGNDLSRVANEIRKLKIVLKPDEILDENIVEKNIGISKEYNVFELQKAVANRDTQKAMRIVFYMGKNMKLHPIQLTIGTFFRFFSNLLLYQTMQGTSQAEMASALGVPVFTLPEYAAAARTYPMKYTTRIISILRDIDMKSKGVGANNPQDSDLLTQMVYQILNIDKLKVKL